MSPDDARAVLEFDGELDRAGLARAYRRKARLHHPDMLLADAPPHEHDLATARFAEVNAAKALLERVMRGERIVVTGPATPPRTPPLDFATFVAAWEQKAWSGLPD